MKLIALIAVALVAATSSRASILHVVGPQPAASVMSMDVKDADLQDFLRLIGEVSGMNVVVDPSVKGKTVTMRLIDVPWDRAMEMALASHNLAAVIEGNVIRVAPTAKFTQEQQQTQQLQQARDAAGTLATIAYPLSYADASAVEAIVRKSLTPRGTISVDKRTNTLIVTDVESVVSPLTGTVAAGSVAMMPGGRWNVVVRDAANGRVVSQALIEAGIGERVILDGVVIVPQLDGTRVVLTLRPEGGGAGAWLPAHREHSLRMGARDIAIVPVF